MPPITPIVPQEITVHLGSPSSYAQNVTVPFVDYIKNVASSEIYPTWDDSAIRANVLAQVSYALNRVYTEYYPSRGYDFNITNSTAVDQKFIQGRNTFENIDRIVEEIFNDYIRRIGVTEPLAAKYCNGTTSTCAGLSQWGSQELAESGFDSFQILQNYYGDDIEIVVDAPIGGIQSLYPGQPLRQGDSGSDVSALQVALNRIAQNYPAIPKIEPVDGYFGQSTESAVRKFQEIFNLAVDGIAGRATFNQIIKLYVGILKLSELTSEGQRIFGNSIQYPETLSPGDSGEEVMHLQYMLDVLSSFIQQIPPVEMTGAFDQQTENAVIAFQKYKGLADNGIVNRTFWDLLNREFNGIDQTVLSQEVNFPNTNSGTEVLPAASRARVSLLQQRLNRLGNAFPDIGAIPVSGVANNVTAFGVRKLQTMAGLPVTGKMDSDSWKALVQLEREIDYSRTTRHTQYPGYELKSGMNDEVTR